MRIASVNFRDATEGFRAKVGQLEGVGGHGLVYPAAWLPSSFTCLRRRDIALPSPLPVRACVAHLCTLSQRCASKAWAPDFVFHRCFTLVFHGEIEIYIYLSPIHEVIEIGLLRDLCREPKPVGLEISDPKQIVRVASNSSVSTKKNREM